MADLTLALPRQPAEPRARLGRAVGRPLEIAALALLLAFAARLRWLRLDTYTGSFDEGIRSQQLLLMSAGYRPFQDIFSSQGPLLLDLLYPFFALLGQTLEAARSGVAVLSMVGLVGAWWVGRAVAGPIAGLAAVAILTLSPGYLENSRLALAEVPTIAPALLAVGALLRYRATADRRWLVLSAIVCAIAVLIKPMVVHVGAPLLLLLAAPGHSEQGGRLRRVLADVLLYGAVVGVLCGAVLLALGPAQVWESLGAYRTGAGRAMGSELPRNLRLTGNVMAHERIGFFALAAAGLLLGLWRRPIGTAAVAFWAAAVLAFFLAYGDLADKHIVYLVPPVALLGAIGVGLTVELARAALASRSPGAQGWDGAPGRPEAPGWEGARRRIGALRWVGAGLGAVGIVTYATQVGALYAAERFLIYDAEKIAVQRRNRPAELDMARAMRERAAPVDWVLSDNPNAAFRARRLVIPSLVDTSGTRIDAGSLTDARATAAVAQYRPAVIVTHRLRLGKLRDFVRGLPEQGYRLDRTYHDGTFDNAWKVYVRE